MSYRKFEQNDIFTNRIKTHPRTYFLVNNNTTYYNNDIVPIRSGEETILHTPQGHLNLYEMNVNRTEGAGNEGLIYPFITKQGSLESFKTVSTESFQGFSYGDEIEGEYPASSTIAMDYYNSSERPRVHALRNTLNYYKSLSQSYSSENFDTEDVRLISIPSIFYGSSIKKGSVKLNFYKDGALVATIEDSARNGELIRHCQQMQMKARSQALFFIMKDLFYLQVIGIYPHTPKTTTVLALQPNQSGSCGDFLQCHWT